jgi:hypothetical protein
MWRQDRYLVPNWRHGTVTALRAYLALGAEGKSDLSRADAAEIIHDLADGGGGRHHLLALAEGVGGGAGSDTNEQMATATLVSRLLQALDSGRLMFVTGEWAGVAEPNAEDEQAVELIGRLVPHGRRLSFEGNLYRLLPASGWSKAVSDTEEVVPLKEASKLVARMKRKVARNPAQESGWDDLVPLLSERKKNETKPGAILLLRRVLLGAGGAPAEPPPPAAAAPAPVKAPVAAFAAADDEGEEEFSCPEEQAEAMQAAARDGVPFCLECACAAAEKEKQQKKAA